MSLSGWGHQKCHCFIKFISLCASYKWTMGSLTADVESTPSWWCHSLILGFYLENTSLFCKLQLQEEMQSIEDVGRRTQLVTGVSHSYNVQWKSGRVALSQRLTNDSIAVNHPHWPIIFTHLFLFPSSIVSLYMQFTTACRETLFLEKEKPSETTDIINQGRTDYYRTPVTSGRL